MNSLKFEKLTELKNVVSFLIFVAAIFVIIANDNVISTICAYVLFSGLVTLAIQEIRYKINGKITNFTRKVITFLFFLALFPSIAWLARQIAS